VTLVFRSFYGEIEPIWQHICAKAPGFTLLSRLPKSGIALLIALLTLPQPLVAQDRSTGSVTKLPIPRFVSLKPSDTPMREGPSKDHQIKWVFKREGLPVEVIGEHEHWRRVRDSESTDGWVYYGRLSNRRTAIVRANKNKTESEIFSREGDGGAVVARLQAGVIVAIQSCSLDWCKINVENVTGFIRKDAIWGVYSDERIRASD
jgi:SH3-like domain-containing protein